MADGLRYGRALLQIQPDLREPLHLLLEPFVHIVPVLAVFLEKFVELILIVHDKAVKAEHGQPVAHKVDRPRRGLDGHFNPLHDDPPDFRSRWHGAAVTDEVEALASTRRGPPHPSA